MNNPSFFVNKEKTNILSAIVGEKTDILSHVQEHFKELDPSKAEGAGEKHLPTVQIEGSVVTVQVGSVLHPMTDEHSIDWIYLETAQGRQLKFLNPGQEPTAKFALIDGDKPIAAYAYCNLHGFWKTTL